jgi:hypothetical protein
MILEGIFWIKWKKKQDKIKVTLDHKYRQRNFQDGDLVLLWDKRKENLGMHNNFENLWFTLCHIQGDV